MNPTDPLDEILSVKGIQSRLLDKKTGYVIQKQWFLRFMGDAKKETGKYDNYPMWNGFSIGGKGIVKWGLEAMMAYQRQRLEPFFVFNEGAVHCYSCTALHYPDFSVCEHDLYIMPESMRWTMIFVCAYEDYGAFFAICDPEENE